VTLSARPVYVPHVPGWLRPEVLPEIERQGFRPVLVTTPVSDPTAYPGWLRRMWHRGRGWLQVEQRVLPPEGALDRLALCPEPWCLHPLDRINPRVLYALGLVKFGDDLVAGYPEIADRAFARREGELWWQMEHQHAGTQRADAARPPGRGHRARENSGAPLPLVWPGPLWPTTGRWPQVDMPLADELARAGMLPHVHEPVPRNLVDYAERPPGVAVDRWWERSTVRP
jgi:hypothetical protein